MFRSILILLFFVSCKQDSQPKEAKTFSSKRDSATTILKHTSRNSWTKIFLPNKKRSREEIKAIVSEIETCYKNATLDDKEDFHQGCSYHGYYKNGKLVKMQVFCGDCSMNISVEDYFFENNELIAYASEFVKYNYPPCLSDKELKENGVKEGIKAVKAEITNQTYYLLDSLHFLYLEKGGINDTTNFYGASTSVFLKMVSEEINSVNIK